MEPICSLGHCVELIELRNRYEKNLIPEATSIRGGVSSPPIGFLEPISGYPEGNKARTSADFSPSLNLSPSQFFENLDPLSLHKKRYQILVRTKKFLRQKVIGFFLEKGI
ncbi:hypothetical protein ElyMa_005779900 [Elysia marginata]|uniref:Uncharacterized protein n=1 Tax=Elysia marginata TaxID=1093978 RepID=A0AAV4FRV0_9GAST|nr:hypothetical protein ElyMa_005779900 [Elysia marginata]